MHCKSRSSLLQALHEPPVGHDPSCGALPGIDGETAIHRLVALAQRTVAPNSELKINSHKDIPRVIWMLWFDGWDRAGEIQSRCRESWELYNRGWEIRALCRSDFADLFGSFAQEYERLRMQMNHLEPFGGCWVPPAGDSDLVRLFLLARYGGVWVDSTMLCRKPLDEWLPVAAASGFFAYGPEDLVKDDLHVMSSFIASTPCHPLIVAWLQRTREHWSTPKQVRPERGFFWVHNIFKEMIDEDKSLATEWAKVPRVTGEYGLRGPHLFVKYIKRLQPQPTPELKKVIEEDREIAMFKLTNHEVKLENCNHDSCYRFLVEETRRQAVAHCTKAAQPCTKHASGSTPLRIGPSILSASQLLASLADGNDPGVPSSDRNLW
eukprot:gnl/MRDRNA2_/MRDRNA2_190044_c0_seq1.p1 gnl/MRDRNA2_/MRDRNA2_190044_c0~~gnl/MRDRNA2_/MRDRNA2_190044_c0_seq1.p1  ORF type:complete len:379 (+),score=50.30 gnl/MRDRNA2_/MRDRNA2_190044_c0_seq1:123-1259(+)